MRAGQGIGESSLTALLCRHQRVVRSPWQQSAATQPDMLCALHAPEPLPLVSPCLHPGCRRTQGQAQSNPRTGEVAHGQGQRLGTRSRPAPHPLGACAGFRSGEPGALRVLCSGSCCTCATEWHVPTPRHALSSEHPLGRVEDLGSRV